MSAEQNTLAAARKAALAQVGIAKALDEIGEQMRIANLLTLRNAGRIEGFDGTTDGLSHEGFTAVHIAAWDALGVQMGVDA